MNSETRLLTPQDVSDLLTQWLELAAPPPSNREAPTLLTAREVAARLSVSTGTVIRWASDGKIPSFKLPGGAVRFRDDDIANWLESKRRA